MTAGVPFGSRRIGPGLPVLVIAEIGINHEGSVEHCARLIQAAAQAGADAIKLQTVDAAESYAPDTPSYSLFEKAALSRTETADMFSLARRLGIYAFTTAGDIKSFEWVERLDPPAYKISSGLLTHTPLIRRMAATGRTILMSTGMAQLEDIDRAVAAAAGAPVGLFQCTSLYPAPHDTLNLAVICTLGARYCVPIGLSDHSDGIEAAPLAVAAGAVMLEKHFTLDRARPGFDHRLSLEPEKFACMVRAVRKAEAMLGACDKKPVGEEEAMALKARRTLVARRSIRAGEMLDGAAVAILRTAPNRQGLPATDYDRVVGCRARRNLDALEPITADAVESAH